MATDNTKRVELLIRELDTQREAYMKTFERVHELLAQNLAATVPKDTFHSATPPASIPADVNSQRSFGHSRSGAASDRDLEGRKGISFPTSSISRSTGNDSDNDDDDESLYVQEPLPPHNYDIEGLRGHLRSYKWDRFGRRILEGIVGNPARLQEPALIPNTRGKLDDRSHLTHYQVFDVGPDGSPLQVEFPQVELQNGRAMAIWNAIKEVNPISKQRHAVGRITILREPSPILFGALHYTMYKHFDVDELFRHLFEADLPSANMQRIFDDDPRHHRSFVFNFEYFTLLGKDCEPMKWQLAAGQEDRKPGHIAITRCSSVVALVLNGEKLKELKNPSRAKTKDKGPVYDPFSPWQVLNIQCYPDFKASLDVHDSTKHYVNGPEAFMSTLLGEYRDAHRRFSDITKRISARVRPPLEFMFDAKIRDGLLFEDDEYSMARRYFWAHQTLGIMNESIKALISAYEDSFPDSVWEGKHKIVWPLQDEHSSRNQHYKKKMASLKKEFDKVLEKLRKLVEENNVRRGEVQELREDLFTGTSIQESRKSVTATFTTVQQGHNIKLLTLVSIFFLPLTFATSVFGMTNMPTKKHWWMLAIVMTTVCVPCFILVGSLNSRRGLEWWKHKTTTAFDAAGAFFGWLIHCGRKRPGDSDLISVKSFESHKIDTLPLRRWSSTQNQKERQAARSELVIEEPASREEEQQRKALETGPPLSPTFRPPLSVARSNDSSIAKMMKGEKERRRKLRYSEDT